MRLSLLLQKAISSMEKANPLRTLLSAVQIAVKPPCPTPQILLSLSFFIICLIEEYGSLPWYPNRAVLSEVPFLLSIVISANTAGIRALLKIWSDEDSGSGIDPTGE
jgi:hypothetical protein